MRFQVDETPCSGQRGVVGGQFVAIVADKLTHAERVGYTPGNATLGVDPLEVAQKECTKILARFQAGPSENRGIEGLTNLFDKGIEPVLRQDFVEPLIKRMSGRTRQIGGRQKERLLSAGFAFAHRHAKSS